MLLGAVFGFALMFGPLSGLVIGKTNLQTPYLVASVLEALNVLYTYAYFPETVVPRDSSARTLSMSESAEDSPEAVPLISPIRLPTKSTCTKPFHLQHVANLKKSP
jgi:hypothetical protein